MTTLKHVSEAIADHLYNMNLYSQIEVAREQFGLQVEVDYDDDILFEGQRIEDFQFDDMFTNIIENMSVSEIVDVWGEMNGVEMELDETGENVVEAK